MTINHFTAAVAAITLVLVFFIHLNTKKINMKNEEILAKLQEADEATNEIAADLQDLINNQQVSPEVAEKLNAHVDKLKGVASTHTPAAGGGEGGGTV